MRRLAWRGVALLAAFCAITGCDAALGAAAKYVAHESGRPDHIYYGATARALYRAQPHTWAVAERSFDIEGGSRYLLIDTAHMTVNGTTRATVWVATVNAMNGHTQSSFGQLIDFSCDPPHRDRYADRQDFDIPGDINNDSLVVVTTWDTPFEQQVRDHSGDMSFFRQIVCDLTWQRRGSPKADFTFTTP